MYQGRVINKHEVLSDGTRVWINGPDGASVARFSVIQGLSQAAIDVHHPLREQAEKGECLDCARVPVSLAAWERFVASVQKHHGVRVPDDYKPRGLR